MRNQVAFKPDSAVANKRGLTVSQKAAEICAVINYIDRSVERVDADPVADYDPPPADAHEVTIRNARLAGATFANEGFEVHRLPGIVQEKGALIGTNGTLSTETPAASRAYQISILLDLEELSQAREVVPFVAGPECPL